MLRNKSLRGGSVDFTETGELLDRLEIAVGEYETLVDDTYSLNDLQGVWDTTGLATGTMTVNSDGTFTDPQDITGTFTMTGNNEFTATVDVRGNGDIILTYVWVFTDIDTATITVTGPINGTVNCTRRV